MSRPTNALARRTLRRLRSLRTARAGARRLAPDLALAVGPPRLPESHGMSRSRWILPTVLLAVLCVPAGCSTVPERSFALERARTQLQAASRDPAVLLNAQTELRHATDALSRAEQAHADRRPPGEVDHLAHLGLQRVTIAQETAADRVAQDDTAAANAERRRLQLALQAQDADAAAHVRAGAAQAEQVRLDDLARQLGSLNARATERGIVVSLGDMLFDAGGSQLQAGSAAGVAKMADFMKRHPTARAVVEGYTDNVGDETANLVLSERRAEAVMAALVEMGVDAERLNAHGYGPHRPAASNASAAGRQANRRVEIVLAPESVGMPGR